MLPVVSEQSLDTYLGNLQDYTTDDEYIATCLELIKKENPNLFLIIMFYLEKQGKKSYSKMAYGMCTVYMMLKNQDETNSFVEEMESTPTFGQ